MPECLKVRQLSAVHRSFVTRRVFGYFQTLTMELKKDVIERGLQKYGNIYEDGRISVPVKPPNPRYILVFLTASVSILALFLLAAGLSSLSFPAGERFVLPQNQQVEVEGPRFSLSTTVLQALLLIGAVMLVAATILVVSSKSARRDTVRRTLVSLAYLAVYALILLAIRWMQGPEEAALPEVTDAPAPSSPFTGGAGLEEAVEVITITPPDPPAWLGFIVSLAVVLLAAGIVYYVWKSGRTPQEDLGEIARTALSDLSKGQKWDDVVIRCYRDMTEAVVRAQRLKRPDAMTASEYALRLEEAGLPARQVQNLTRLFEKARYGAHESDPEDIQEAISCLSAIRRALEKKA